MGSMVEKERNKWREIEKWSHLHWGTM